MRTFAKVFSVVGVAFLLLLILVGVFAGGGKERRSHNTALSKSRQATPTPTPPATSAAVVHKHHRRHARVVLTNCHARDGGKLPDPRCPPGASYAKVTQANIGSTICVVGWTDTVRPSVDYTDGVKARQIRLYGYADTDPSDFEEDHLVPLELGGAPYSRKNLWPEHGSIPNRKDAVENALHDAVCSGTVSLHAARHAMAHNWLTAERALGISGSGSGGSSRGGGGGSGGGGGGTPTGCTPKTDSGHCYEPGEFCRDSDHGVTGVAGNGEAIKCEDTGSGTTWHWEPV